jgi:hypothetical protein
MSRVQPLLNSPGFQFIKRLMPEFVKSPLRQAYTSVSFSRRASTAPYYCPVCPRGLSRFREVEWKDTRCVFCNSDTRQRLVWSFFCGQTNLLDGQPKGQPKSQPKHVLHVAPERQFSKRLSKVVGAGYITADLIDPGVSIRLDITQIPFPENSFDVIVCSHVLEHVPKDRQAMREFVRVLKPQGWAVIMVPCKPEQGPTFEDWSVTDPGERRRLFLQEDQVRIYGNDFVERLEQSGFAVQVYRAVDFLSSAEIGRMNITAHSGDIFFCTKR